MSPTVNSIGLKPDCASLQREGRSAPRSGNRHERHLLPLHALCLGPIGEVAEGEMSVVAAVPRDVAALREADLQSAEQRLALR